LMSCSAAPEGEPTSRSDAGHGPASVIWLSRCLVLSEWSASLEAAHSEDASVIPKESQRDAAPSRMARRRNLADEVIWHRLLARC